MCCPSSLVALEQQLQETKEELQALKDHPSHDTSAIDQQRIADLESKCRTSGFGDTRI